MAARQGPQLRAFRNDFGARSGGVERRPAALAVRLVGTASNRDAGGARGVVETERLRRTKVVHAGSGFLSQGSKELLFGLGQSQRIVKLTVEWPSGSTQAFTDVVPNSRLRLVEGGELESQPFQPPSGTGVRPPGVRPPGVKPLGRRGQTPGGTWLYEPFPAPDFSLEDTSGTMRSLAALRGRPAVLLFWSSDVDASRAALDDFVRGSGALARSGVGALAIALDPPEKRSQIRAVSSGAVPVVLASEDAGLSYAILNRHVFMNRQDMRIPTTMLLDEAGRVVKVYRDRVDVAVILRDASAIDVPPAERLARAVPFPGTLYSPAPLRNYLPYGRELLDQGLEAAALVAFERAAQASPNAFTLYRLGTLLSKRGETARAREAFERALRLQPDLAEASNDLGALLAQGGEVEAGIKHFRAALAVTPEYPDALNNLGYALLLTGRDQEARQLYEKAIALQPDFPEALNNLGLLVGRAGELERAEHYFRGALAKRDNYGEAANNLALVLVARSQADEAIRLLEALLAKSPQFESGYVTLAKIHLSAGRTPQGIGVLERLLQRNPTHPVALELLRQFQPR